MKLPNGIDTVVLSVDKYKNGNIAFAQIGIPTEINTKYGNITFTDYLTFYKTGELGKGVLAKPTKIKLPILDTNVYLKGGIAFYKNGNLMTGAVTKKYQIKTIAGKTRFKDYITLHKNGMLKAGTPITPFKYAEFNINKIIYRNDGEVIGGYFNKTITLNTPVGKLRVKGATYFDPEHIDTCYLDHDQLIETPIGIATIVNEISFYKNGNIRTINTKTVVMPYNKRFNNPTNEYDEINYVEFYETGELKISKTQFSKYWNIKQITNGKHTIPIDEIMFYKNGNIKRCHITESFMLDVKYYQDEAVVFFNEAGKIAHILSD